jgi:hypothetical protein
MTFEQLRQQLLTEFENKMVEMKESDINADIFFLLNIAAKLKAWDSNENLAPSSSAFYSVTIWDEDLGALDEYEVVHNLDTDVIAQFLYNGVQPINLNKVITDTNRFTVYLDSYAPLEDPLRIIVMGS